MSSDPFDVLGLPADASAADVRSARRRLAKHHHPDVGGDPGHMRTVNAAVAAALRAIAARSASPAGRAVDDGAGGAPRRDAPPGRRPVPGTREGRMVLHDVASFTVEAPPPAAFAALLVVAASLGETLVDEPPDVVEAHLDEPFACWCRLEILPEAGASTVSLTVAPADVGPMPDLDAVRDAWVAELNDLDWEGSNPLDRRHA